LLWTFLVFVGDVPVAGVSFGESRVIALNFILGRDRSLRRVKASPNPLDPNVFKVTCLWISGFVNRHEGQIGWVPKELAARLAKMDGGKLHATLRILFKAARNKYPGIRFDVWKSQ
jgi:hypothetical protein